MRRLPCAAVAAALLVTAGAPARAQDLGSGMDLDRAAAEQTLDRSRRLRLMGAVGGGLAIAAMFTSNEQRTSGAGMALAVGGLTSLGLGLIGDVGRYRGATRLDALDRAAARGGPARAEAERALRQGRRLGLVGDIGAAMVLAAPFFPDRVFCGSEAETCSGASKAYILSGAAAVGIGIFGRVKARRAAGRLETLDETPRASHGIGVAPLPDGVAASYTVAW